MIAYPGPEMVVAPGGAGRGPVTSKSEKDGGEGGIRTHAPLAQRPLFESGTMNHSVTSPTSYSTFVLTKRQETLDECFEKGSPSADGLERQGRGVHWIGCQRSRLKARWNAAEAIRRTGG